VTATEQRESALIEKLGRLAEGEGLPRIGGRMLGYLAISGAPRSIDELAATLKVSRASISTNGKLLQSIGLLERTTIAGDRRDYLRVTGDAAHVLAALGVRRLQSMRDVIRTMRLAARERSATRARIQRLERLYDGLIGRLRLELTR
jgi:DNA-binding transcriptional regulator GbsR (MarR family)